MSKKRSADPTQQPTLAQLIRRRRNRIIDREEAWALVRRIILIGVCAWLLLTHVFMITQVEGMTMFPAVKDGDLAIVYRLQTTYNRGDVVMFRHNGVRHVGRVAARGTDVINIDTFGEVLVNGAEDSSEIMYPTYPREDATYPQTVPADSVYILCDYRTQAQDSRDFGPIPLDDVEGKVITILRRRGL